MKFDAQTELKQLRRLLLQQRRFIAGIALVSAMLGLVVAFVRPKTYVGETKFILKNHLFADRTYLYSKDMRYINYYASEDDIERLVALEDADTVMSDLINNLQLARYYKASPADTGLRKLRKKIASRVKIYRTPEKHAVLAFEDKDPKMAARIANEYLRLIEFHLRNNYNSVRQDVFEALKEKIAEEEHDLQVLTDSLVALRERYGIYDIISPTRGNMVINSRLEANGKPDFARGLELIQNLESIKDRAVADLSDHVSLANQYSGSEQVQDLSLIQIVKLAVPPLRPSSVGIIGSVLVCFGLGFAFAVVLVVVRAKKENERAA